MDIKNEIINCHKCGNLTKLAETHIQIGITPFIIIGESPAKDGWIQSKRAFYNSKGQLQGTGRVLEKLLNGIGYSVKDIYFTECCKCIIDDRKKLMQSSLNCLRILYQELKSIPCNILIPMGLHPTQALLNKKITKFADIVGKIFELELNNRIYKVIPIYHASPLNPKGYKGNIEIFDKIKEMCK